MCNRSLRCRVIISLLVVLMLGFGTLAFNFYDTRDQLRRSIMLIQAHEIGSKLNSHSDFSQLPTHYAGGELSYTLYSADGKLLWYSANLDRPRRLHRGSLQNEIQLIRTTVRSSRGYVINAPVTLTDGAILMVTKEDKLERELIGNLLYQRTVRSVLLLIPFCLLAVGLLYLLMRWTLHPIQKAAELAEGIGPHDPNRRIPLNKLPDEVLPLARVANAAIKKPPTGLPLTANLSRYTSLPISCCLWLTKTESTSAAKATAIKPTWPASHGKLLAPCYPCSKCMAAISNCT